MLPLRIFPLRAALASIASSPQSAPIGVAILVALAFFGGILFQSSRSISAQGLFTPQSTSMLLAPSSSVLPRRVEPVFTAHSTLDHAVATPSTSVAPRYAVAPAAEPTSTSSTLAQSPMDAGRPLASYMSGRAAAARLYTVEGHHPLSVLDLDPDRLAPMTHEIQRLIYASQNPPDCEKAQYLVMMGINSGVGSSIHVLGAHAMHAIRTGRVLLWAGDFGRMYTDHELCGEELTWSCHLRWPSKCLLGHARARPDTMDCYETFNPLSQKDGEVRPRMNAAEYFAPAVMEIFNRSGLQLQDDELTYWWRAQSTAYFLRLNDKAVTDLAEKRRALGSLVAWSKGGNASRMLDVPLPSGTVGMHVRHGDKGRQMKLVPFERFMELANSLQRNNPFHVQRAVFVSTEDPAVILQTQSEAVMGDWSTLTYSMPRFNDYNGPADQLNKLSSKISPGRLTRLHILQLLMALECDAWIGTLLSNWNRLIDELRTTWVGKLQHPYVEAGPDPTNYEWRR